MMRSYKVSGGGAVLGLLLLIPLIVIAALLVGGFFTMLGLGILNDHFMSAVPALGYGDSVWTTLGILLVFGTGGLATRSAN